MNETRQLIAIVPVDHRDAVNAACEELWGPGCFSVPAAPVDAPSGPATHYWLSTSVTPETEAFVLGHEMTAVVWTDFVDRDTETPFDQANRVLAARGLTRLVSDET